MQRKKQLEPGQVCTGVVSAVSDFYLTIDLGGGVHGTVTPANLSWAKVDHPSQVAQVGQQVTVVFLSIDPDRGNISVSLKDLEPDPLIEFSRTQLGRITLGRITKLTAIGAFLRLPSGIEALLPNATPGKAGPFRFEVGNELAVRVEYINLHRRQVHVALAESTPRTDAHQ
ncbi:S1 RNA-binding domain-containing protein [Streptomyces sp. NPDC056224]|uniref:S1 RNA-binding domain-containing protein n=1 Tax=Streptomyces sp. NPDC056224 TaxID=3345750 RepID=UPI0035DFBE57